MRFISPLIYGHDVTYPSRLIWALSKGFTTIPLLSSSSDSILLPPPQEEVNNQFLISSAALSYTGNQTKREYCCCIPSLSSSLRAPCFLPFC